MHVPFLHRRRPTVSVIRLSGTIGAAGRGGPGGMSDSGLARVIERAFRRKHPVAVALAINSPGGSPVQSSLIAARIRRLAEERRLPVHAFVEDVAASGGYWLATAADDIWADESSLLGSIGVIAAGFGFTDLIARWGIERRVHTAGAAKSLLDPFRPETPDDIARLERLLTPIHDAFKAQVRRRRGGRLAQGLDLFTGDVWVGRDAVAMGLADGIGHLTERLREVYGPKVRMIEYGQKQPWLRRIGILGPGTSPEALLAAAAERAAWQQYGVGP